MKQPGRYCVVTALSPNLWKEYLLFYKGLRLYNDYHLYVIGLELDKNQETFIKQQSNVTFIPLAEEDVTQLKTIDDDWRKWYKPYYINLVNQTGVPDVLLWLDTDIVPTGPLEPLFERVEESFFVIRDYFAPKFCHNEPALYKLLGMAEPKNKTVLNSGVFGWQRVRDQPLFDQWITNVRQAHTNRDILTLQQLGLMDCILNKIEWNWPARRIFYHEFEDLIAGAGRDNPEALLIHYAGCPKLANLQSVNDPVITNYFRQRLGNFYNPKKFFITGCEAYLATLAATLRRASIHGGYFYYDDSVGTAMAVTDFSKDYAAVFARQATRTDCPIYYFISPYYSYLTAHLNRLCPDHCLILVLNDPLEEIRFWIENYYVFPDLLHLYPGFYQVNYLRRLRSDRALAIKNNIRVKGEETTLIDRYLALLLGRLQPALERCVQSIRTSTFWAVRPDDLVKQTMALAERRMFHGDWKLIQTQKPALPSGADAWIDDLLRQHKDRIISAYYNILLEYRVATPSVPL
jgi:hypothetical protein